MVQQRFAPLDYPTPETVKGFLKLFNHFSVPASFLCERIQSVTHSFGADSNDQGDQSKSLIRHDSAKYVNGSLIRSLVPLHVQEPRNPGRRVR